MNYELKELRNRILCGNSIDVLPQLPAKSCDACITSPPYLRQRDYHHDDQLGQEATTEEYITKLCKIFEEVKRVLKDSGSLWVVIGDKHLNNRCLAQVPSRFAEEMTDKYSWILIADLIWQKPNCMPSSVKDSFTVDYEHFYFFVKKNGYYFDTQYEPLSPITIKEIEKEYNGRARKDYANQGIQDPSEVKRRIIAKFKPIGGVKRAGGDSPSYSGNEYEPDLARGRIMRATWYPEADSFIYPVHTQPFNLAHFATYPEELIKPAILASVPPFICRHCGSMFNNKVTEIRIATRPGINTGTGKSGTAEDPNSSLHKSPISTKRERIVRMLNENYDEDLCHCQPPELDHGIVLDPFFGAGTTGLVALKNARDFIGIEIQPQYIDIAKQRLSSYLGQKRLF
jgi:DNA modification methylase